ncbi:unnamed protein product [Cylindrotheca closterium]|uniref:Helicase-associated domain-containing protein n=1 Tax=Cylindrotheca closterium TaxID=2856 RepID=A0AAD2CTZ9_9STRA|nr:unnamed protein product [Cylindrotheca closterium]
MANQRCKRRNNNKNNNNNNVKSKGNHAPLSEEQIRLLDKIDFQWTPREDLLETEWNANYQKLANFYNKKHHHHHHHHPRNSHHKAPLELNSSLHHWAAIQRRKRQGIKPYTPLTSRQIQLLDQIHFSWNPEQDERDRQLAVWHAKYHVLVNFYNKHGHLKVKYGSSLYQWMVTQRQRRYGTGKQTPLSPEQVRLLNAIGFSWAPTGGPHEIAWYNKYQELAKCYREHGDLRAAIKAPSTLYTWMVNQRQRRAGKGDFSPLNEEQIRLLDEIHFEWSPSEISGGGALGGARAIKWHQKYQELVDFYQQHGHFKVERPSSMYTWMSNQRTKRKNTILLRQTNKKIHAKGRMATLTNEQIQLLNEIGFPWEPRRKRAPRRVDEAALF